MSAATRKGTRAAERVVQYLIGHGFPYAERRAQYGALDRGDVTGVPGVAIEVKAVAKPEYGVWLGEAEIERRNAGAAIGVVIHKPTGIDDASQYRVIMTLATFCDLIREDVGE